MLSIQEGGYLHQTPNVVTDTRFHGRCYSKRPMNTGEIVMHEMKAHRSRKILPLLGEAVS